MTGRHLLAWVVLIAVLGAGCGVRPSGVIPGGPAPTGRAEGATLYFLTGATLMKVRRSTPQHLSPTQALTLLENGPTSDDWVENLRSEVPAGLGPVAVTIGASGTVEVVVSTDVRTLSATAVDQIVCTVGDALSTTAPVTLTSRGATRGPRICPLAG